MLYVAFSWNECYDIISRETLSRSVHVTLFSFLEWAIPQLSNTLSSTRLVVARGLLEQANRVLDRLENVTAATNDSAVPESDEEESDGMTALQRLIFDIGTAVVGSGRRTYVRPSRSKFRHSYNNSLPIDR